MNQSFSHPVSSPSSMDLASTDEIPRISEVLMEDEGVLVEELVEEEDEYAPDTIPSPPPEVELEAATVTVPAPAPLGELAEFGFE